MNSLCAADVTSYVKCLFNFVKRLNVSLTKHGASMSLTGRLLCVRDVVTRATSLSRSSSFLCRSRPAHHHRLAVGRPRLEGRCWPFMSSWSGSWRRPPAKPPSDMAFKWLRQDDQQLLSWNDWFPTRLTFHATRSDNLLAFTAYCQLCFFSEKLSITILFNEAPIIK